MSDAAAELRDHKATKPYLIAIDSDGCAFDTMEIKHKECFIPNIIKHWGLQPVSKFARTVAEFVNLYSKWRGVNRFPALLMTFDLLAEWDQVLKRGYQPPSVPGLRHWVETESKLGNPALEAHMNEHDAPDLRRALDWSRAVNETVADIVQGGLPPFPDVTQCLENASSRADMMVCSSTPTEALRREWREQGLAAYVFAINGQEVGKKSEQIELAGKGKYEEGHVLMIGDAPGDMRAAKANNAFFYPIMPGEEDASWRRLKEEGLDKFFGGGYGGAYEEQLIAEFEAHLPETPPWKP